MTKRNLKNNFKIMSLPTEKDWNPELSEASLTLSNFIKFLRDIIIIFLLAFSIRSFIATPFQIDGNSMNNNYYAKEYILVNTVGYLNFDTHFNDYLKSNPDPITGAIAKILKKIPLHIGDPKRGDVIVLKPHVDASRQFYLKRVIGLPWEEIKFWSGQVFIKKIGDNDFIQLDEPYLSLANSGQTFMENRGEKTFKIPENHYWVMGDNRTNSSDSRDCFRNCSYSGSTHFLAREDIIGKVAVSFGYFNIFQEKNFPKLGSLSWEVDPRFFNTPKTHEYPELSANND